jgi:hypothetical protein
VMSEAIVGTFDGDEGYDSVDIAAIGNQQAGQVRSILTSDPRDESRHCRIALYMNFHSPRSPCSTGRPGSVLWAELPALRFAR